MIERYDIFREYVRENFSQTTQELTDRVIEFAASKVGSELRYDGTPLLDHAVQVALIAVKEIGLGRNSAVAAIIHDVVRIADKEKSENLVELLEQIRTLFGEQVVGITVGLANISSIKLKTSKEQASDFRDMIVSYSEDPRVILIKLADRLEVMRSLKIFPKDKWRKKSWESTPRRSAGATTPTPSSIWT